MLFRVLLYVNVLGGLFAVFVCALAPFAGQLHPGLTVIDIVPKPETTSLLALAREKGCPVANGAAMISGQADALLSFFGIAAS